MGLRLPKLPKARPPKSTKATKSQKGSVAGGFLGGMAAGSMLSSIFGSSGGSGKFSNDNKAVTSGRKKRSGEANYGPLPSFNQPSVHAQKISNPTLSTLGEQMSKMLAKMLQISGTLKAQFDLDKQQYKDKARIQREINAENDNIAIIGAPTAGLNLEPLQDIINKLINIIDNISNNGGSGFGIPPIIPLPGGKGGAAAKTPAQVKAGREKFEQSKFVKKADALDKNGKVRAGYEPVVSKAGKTVGYRKTAGGNFLRKISKFSPRLGTATSITGSVLKGVGRLPGKMVGGALGAVTSAIMAYQAWQEIQALPKDLPKREKKRAVSKIVGKLVGQIGLMAAGASLGAMAGGVVGSAFGGVGAAPGAVIGTLGGIIGSIGATYVLGETADSLVEKIVDTVYPEKEEVVKQTKPTVRKAAIRNQESTQTIKSTPKSSVSTTKQVEKPTVSELISTVSSRVGVDSGTLYTIAKQSNGSINPTSRVDGKVFDLTSDQWTQIKTKYGSTYKELTNPSDPKATAMAAALLTKDAGEFLAENNIPATPDKLFAAYLVGNKGVSDLLDARSDTPVNQIVAQATYKDNKLFTNSEGKPLTTGEFLQKTFDISTSRSNELSAAVTSGQVPHVPETSTATTKPAATPVAEPTASAESSTPWYGNGTPTNEDWASKNGVSTAQPAATPVAEPIQEPLIGQELDKQSEDIKNLEQDSSTSMASITPASSTSGPAIMPSQRAGYTGTGHVPDPNFNLGDIAMQLFFKTTPEGIWA